jgi:hypothetical protein
MAIARKPDGKPAPAIDAKAESFISGAGQGAAGAAQPAMDEEPGSRRQPVMIRFDKELLARVDKAARRRGVNRSAWISYVISQALEGE